MYYTESMKINGKVKQLAFFGKESRAGLVIMAEIAAGAMMALASLWVFAEITDEVIEKETAAFDNSVQTAIYSFRTPALTSLMFTASFLGSKEFIFAVSIIVITVLLVKNKRKTAATYAATLLLSIGLNNLIKFLIHRDRPDLPPLEEASFYSFPSGHSMNSLVFYGLLAYFTYHYSKNRPLGLAAYLFAAVIVILIGFSRIYLGAHYPTDVLAGFIAGVCVLSAAAVIDKTLRLNELFKKFNNQDR